MSPLSEARKRANKKWDAENLEQLQVKMKKGMKDQYKAHALAMGETLNSFANRALRETMERDNSTREDQQT